MPDRIKNPPTAKTAPLVMCSGSATASRLSGQPAAKDKHEDPVEVLEHLKLRVLLALLKVKDRAVDWRSREQRQSLRTQAEPPADSRETAVHIRNVVSVTLKPMTMASRPIRLAVSSSTETVPSE